MTVKPGHGIVLTVLALLMLGVLMIASAGLDTRAEAPPLGLRDILFGTPAKHALLALAALGVGALVPIGRLYAARGLRSPLVWLPPLIVALLVLVWIPGFGVSQNGASRWLQFGPIRFQPSEVAKWGMPIILALHASRRSGAMDRFGVGFAMPIVVLLGICALISVEDLGTAMLVGVVGVAILLAGGARLVHVGSLVPIGVALVAAAVIARPYRIARLVAYLDPFADPKGSGWHVIQSFAAIGSGGLTGRGLGNGEQKFGYLSDDTTDFIFAIVCEELGFGGAIAVVSAFLLLLACGWTLLRARAEVDPEGRDPATMFSLLLGLGILLTIGVQAAINLTVVTGLAPTKGIALPFVSRGGTGWILSAFSLGLLLAIERRSEEIAQGRAPGVPGASETDASMTPTLAPARQA